MSEVLLYTDKLCKSYAGLRANYNLDLQLMKGEIHALIGPNGAGKSTAVAQISGELAADSGHIYFAGRDITHVPVYDRARAGVSRSFQVTSVFDEMTVLDNLALAVQAHQGHSYRFWAPVNRNSHLNQQAAHLAMQFGPYRNAGRTCSRPITRARFRSPTRTPRAPPIRRWPPWCSCSARTAASTT